MSYVAYQGSRRRKLANRVPVFRRFLAWQQANIWKVRGYETKVLWSERWVLDV